MVSCLVLLKANMKHLHMIKTCIPNTSNHIDTCQKNRTRVMNQNPIMSKKTPSTSSIHSSIPRKCMPFVRQIRKEGPSPTHPSRSPIVITHVNSAEKKKKVIYRFEEEKVAKLFIGSRDPKHPPKGPSRFFVAAARQGAFETMKVLTRST